MIHTQKGKCDQPTPPLTPRELHSPSLFNYNKNNIVLNFVEFLMFMLKTKINMLYFYKAKTIIGDLPSYG